MSDHASNKTLLWGIDGGGTKTTLLLAEGRPNSPPRILASIRAGSSNVNSRPWDEITAELSAAMQSAFESASLPPQPVAVLVAAFAGVGSPTVRDQWQNWISDQHIAEKVRIVDDGEPLIAAGLPEGWGIVLIVGTGSAAFGRSPAGQSARAGGWGYLFGDEGSGFAIGQAALRAMTHVYDRHEEPTPLMLALAEKWAINMPRDIVERVYRAAEPRQQIAEVAQVVCAAAETGDPQSQQILTGASEQLATLVQTVAKQLGIAAEFPLALSGGVAVNSLYLQHQIAAELDRRGLRTGPIAIVDEPARGCIELAWRIAMA
ncbi:MAG: BadF/BadG/BcrA/BcrD ATPase family protein [Pirellulales bacterium]